MECFASRLGIALKGRSARSFARASGVSETVMRKYLAGKSEPTRPALVALAREANVNVDWLATGEGPMLRSQPQPSAPGYAPKPAPDKGSQNVREPDAPMDTGLLATAVRITDDVLHQYHVRERVDSEGFAELVRVVYQDLAHGRAEDAASEALDRILAITRTPP